MKAEGLEGSGTRKYGTQASENGLEGNCRGWSSRVTRQVSRRLLERQRLFRSIYLVLVSNAVRRIYSFEWRESFEWNVRRKGATLRLTALTQGGYPSRIAESRPCLRKDGG